MTRTARRRWSREFPGEIDGIALGATGPVFVHGYDPPAGGKWIDSVIPGKLGAFERSTGDPLWVSPCEVGYGRGFGGGPGEADELVLLGPGSAGHRIVRVSAKTGELIGAREISPFDQALVAADVCVTVMPRRVAGILTSPMLETWSHSHEGERYHQIGRSGRDVFVAYTDGRRRQGVLCLDAQSGEPRGTFVDPTYPVIHELACEGGLIVLLVGSRPAGARSAGTSTLRLEAFRIGESAAHPIWAQELADESPDELPDSSISLDSGKVYVAHGALLSVRDGLSGRDLGEMTIPGLDERVAWSVSQGAGLLAEETRASVFELPA
jgi:hypothetical protein